MFINTISNNSKESKGMGGRIMEKETVLIKKRWRAKKNDYYHYINGFISIVEAVDLKFVEDNERYKAGNYFKTKEIAEKYLADFKKFSIKWHEENGTDGNED